MNANQWRKQRTLGRSWSPQSHGINRYKFPILTKTKKNHSAYKKKNSKVLYISGGKQKETVNKKDKLAVQKLTNTVLRFVEN